MRKGSCVLLQWAQRGAGLGSSLVVMPLCTPKPTPVGQFLSLHHLPYPSYYYCYIVLVHVVTINSAEDSKTQADTASSNNAILHNYIKINELCYAKCLVSYKGFIRSFFAHSLTDWGVWGCYVGHPPPFNGSPTPIPVLHVPFFSPQDAR